MCLLSGAIYFSRDRIQVCFGAGPVSQNKTKQMKNIVFWIYPCTLESSSIWPQNSEPQRRRDIFILKKTPIWLILTPLNSAWCFWSLECLLLNSRSFILRKDDPTRIQLKLCLGQPQSGSCPNCGKSSSTILSVILYMVLNIWSTFAVW